MGVCSVYFTRNLSVNKLITIWLCVCHVCHLTYKKAHQQINFIRPYRFTLLSKRPPTHALNGHDKKGWKTN